MRKYFEEIIDIGYIKSYFAYEFYIKKTYKLIYYSSANVMEFVEIETDYQDFIQYAIHSE